MKIYSSRPDSSRRLASLLCFLFIVLVAPNAMAARHKHAKQARHAHDTHHKEYSELHVTEGQQEHRSYGHRLDRASVGNSEIADIVFLKEFPEELLIIGRKPGQTNLLVWLAGKSKPLRYRLRVDPAVIEGQFGSLEDHESKVPPEKGQPDARDATTVDTGGTQIQADIKVVEVSRTGLKEAGFFFGKNSSNTTLAVAPPGTLSGVSSQSGTASAASLLLQSAAGFFPYGQAYEIVFGNAGQGWLASISLLEQSGYAYTLAEPSLVVMNGQTASFLAGGEFPIPVPQSGAATGAITIRFKEFGVRLMLTPTILKADRIAMKVAPEVSELDFNAGILSGGTRVPALKVRRTDTTIEMSDGESFAISGLISQNTIANEDKLPWLGDLPYIGPFFRSKRFQKDDKELLMVVTPHIVHPLSRDAELPPLPGEAYRRTDPDYSEFFMHNQTPSGRQRGNLEGFSR